MAKVTLEIKGLDNLLKMAEKYPAVSIKHINNAINESLVRIRKGAVDNSPVLTGKLKGTWALKPVTNLSGTLQNLAQTKKSAYYANFVEFGTSRGIKPQRFLQRSVASNEASVNNAFSKALDNILKEI